MSCVARWAPGIALLVSIASAPAQAHDASAYGGVFRSRNMGATWVGADTGLFLNAPLAVAVSPRDANLLLLGTELGVFRSSNGGRSWEPEAKDQIVGPVFALAFAPDGAGALCAGQSNVFRLRDDGWSIASAPPEALPARSAAFDGTAGHIYLLGRRRLFESVDGGQSFALIASDLPDAAEITALALVRAPDPELVAIVSGAAMTSGDGGRHWQARPVDAAAGPLEALAADPSVPGRVWAAGVARLFRSDDAGARWQPAGTVFPNPTSITRGIAADPTGLTLLVATHQGIFRSEDGGASWMVKEGLLPVHLESGPLFRDPADSRVLYALFSLVPYGDVWRTAVQGSKARGAADLRAIGAIVGFLLLLTGGGIWLARVLFRRQAPAASTARAVPR